MAIVGAIVSALAAGSSARDAHKGRGNARDIAKKNELNAAQQVETDPAELLTLSSLRKKRRSFSEETGGETANTTLG